MTDKVKAKIIELVLDVTAGCYVHHAVLMTQGITATQKMPPNVECDCDIGIAVVLRAIRNAGHGIYGKGSSGGDDKGNWFFINDSKHAWNLEHDNYDQQSEECKQFIGSFLGV